MSRTPSDLILSYLRMPGDALVLTGLVRDLKARYPGMRLGVRTPWPDVFKYNPHVETLNPRRALTVELLTKPCIKRSSQGERLHFLKGLAEALRLQMRIECPILSPKPELFFGPEEKSPVSGRYWVLLAGGKDNITIKHWSWKHYQRVVDGLREMGITPVQLGSAKDRHAPLKNVLSLVGKTNLREFFTIIRDSQGVICPVTAAMHVAAACEKPCVVLAGGREEPWWEEYSNRWPGAFGPEADGKVRVEHRFLDTLGRLPCCQARGCWLKLVQPGGEKSCKRPDRGDPEQMLAECMAMLTPDDVLKAVASYPETPMTGHSNPDEEIIRVLGPAPTPQSRPPATIHRGPPDVPLLDHPILGGKITIAAVLYGDYHSLHRRLLESLLATVPSGRVEYRLGLNEVCDETLRYLRTLIGAGEDIRLYKHEENAKKYPVMREMFHDVEHPLSTNYTVWFDDDSYAVNPVWLSVLAETIINGQPRGYRLYGMKFKHTLRNAGEASWFRRRDWCGGRHFQTDKEQEAPNGDKIWFVAGGFWACETATIRTANIPEPQLYHNGGDITIGEQVHQAGGKIKDFNRGKVHVFSSGAPRRGYSEEFPWRK